MWYGTAIVSFHVSDELKEKMDEHGEINWSAVLRSNVEDELDRLGSRNIARAVATSERLSSEITNADVTERNTAETVREWQETRHGAHSDGG